MPLIQSFSMPLYKRLFRYLLPYRAKLILAIVSMGLVAALNGGRVYLIKPLQDQVFMRGDMQTLKTLLWALPAISIFLGLFSYLQNYLMAAVGQKVIRDLRQDMFDHMQLMSMDFFNASSTGKSRRALHERSDGVAGRDREGADLLCA